jgi:hypothetical protein
VPDTLNGTLGGGSASVLVSFVDKDQATTRGGVNQNCRGAVAPEARNMRRITALNGVAFPKGWEWMARAAAEPARPVTDNRCRCAPRMEVRRAITSSTERRVSEREWQRTAALADDEGFVLRDELTPRYRSLLAKWNQQHSRHPEKLISTFSQALKSRPHLRRGVLRAMYRAKDVYVKQAVLSGECTDKIVY